MEELLKKPVGFHDRYFQEIPEQTRNFLEKSNI